MLNSLKQKAMMYVDQNQSSKKTFIFTIMLKKIELLEALVFT